MKILLDTHFLIWSFTNPEKIAPSIAEHLTSDLNEVFYSQASLWEISIKYNLGSLVLNGMSPEEMFEEIDTSHFYCLRLGNEDLISFHRLPIEHRDPFDRIMIWQCINNDLFFLSVDDATPEYEMYGLKILSR